MKFVDTSNLDHWTCVCLEYIYIWTHFWSILIYDEIIWWKKQAYKEDQSTFLIVYVLLKPKALCRFVYVFGLLSTDMMHTCVYWLFHNFIHLLPLPKSRMKNIWPSLQRLFLSHLSWILCVTADLPFELRDADPGISRLWGFAFRYKTFFIFLFLLVLWGNLFKSCSSANQILLFNESYGAVLFLWEQGEKCNSGKEFNNSRYQWIICGLCPTWGWDTSTLGYPASQSPAQLLSSFNTWICRSV